MCPRRHHYAYIEQLPEPQNEYALSGSLFHKAIEYVLTGKDTDEVYQEWHEAVDQGRMKIERDLLEYIVNLYFTHYYKDYNEEETVIVEQTFNKSLDGEDYFVTKLDQAYRLRGLLGVRDTKTTRGQLKYNLENVSNNMQLLTYVPAVEDYLNEKVDFIEIDEVRLAKLATEVPLIKNGKPSTSLEMLSLVTADLYREELEKQNLLNDQKYQNVLFLLEQRGHPLFNRVRVQLLNRNILDSNEEEIESIYTAASIDTKYRIKDHQKCFMCPYKQICEHDEQIGGEKFREQLIENI
jgi:hypothetical protein